MNATLFVSHKQVLTLREEALTDGSKVYNFKFKGSEEIPCLDENHATTAFLAIQRALTEATTACVTEVYNL